MLGFILLGFLVGMSHAVEADHLAAVGAMATGETSRRKLVMRGAAWGAGHTITLFIICTAAIVFGFILTDQTAARLEFVVGIMLAVLGIDVVRRMRKRRIHFHAHDHGDGRPHLHAHSHMDSKHAHASDPHHHRHPERLPLRALLVGLVHGAAGSAALLALTVAATKDPWVAVGYVAVFGVGSMVGMALLSLIAAWPLKLAETRAKWLQTGVSAAVAVLAVGLGISVMIETGPLALGLT